VHSTRSTECLPPQIRLRFSSSTQGWGFRGVVDSGLGGGSDWGAHSHGLATTADGRAKGFSLRRLTWTWPAAFNHDHLAQLVRSIRFHRASGRVSASVLRSICVGSVGHPYTDEVHEAAAMLRPEAISLARTAAEANLLFCLKKHTGEYAFRSFPSRRRSRHCPDRATADDPPNIGIAG